jgi:hypothetical protein
LSCVVTTRTGVYQVITICSNYCNAATVQLTLLLIVTTAVRPRLRGSNDALDHVLRETHFRHIFVLYRPFTLCFLPSLIFLRCVGTEMAHSDMRVREIERINCPSLFLLLRLSPTEQLQVPYLADRWQN